MTLVPVATVMPTPIAISDSTATILGALFATSFTLVLVGFALWLIALIDILKSEFKDSSNKLIWVLVTLFLPFLGPIFYFIFGRKQAKKGTGINIKVCFTFLAFFIWYPIGIVLMWFWTKWPKWLKIVLTVIAVLLAALGLFGKYFIK